jgi:hypothetical protein
MTGFQERAMNAAVFLTVVVAAAALVSPAAMAADPVLLADLVGDWKNDDGDPKATNAAVSLRLDQGHLALEANRTPAWTALTQYDTDGAFTFRHDVTRADLLAAKLDDPKKPEAKSDEAIAFVLKELSLNTEFTGIPKRGVRSCSMRLNVIEHGWHYVWDAETKKAIALDRPKRQTTFTQVAYALPDLKKNVVTPSFAVAPGLSEEDRRAAGAEINAYFTDKGAYKAFGELMIAIFKPIIAGAQSAVPAETLFGKMVEELAITAIEKSLAGELEAKQFANAVMKTYLKRVLEGVADKPPFDRIAGMVDRLTYGNADKIADKALSKLEIQKLEALLKAQCRFELVTLWSSKAVGGGLAIVDKRLGTAEIFLYLPKRDARPALTVAGTLNRLPETDQRPKGVLSIAFAPLAD